MPARTSPNEMRTSGKQTSAAASLSWPGAPPHGGTTMALSSAGSTDHFSLAPTNPERVAVDALRRDELSGASWRTPAPSAPGPLLSERGEALCISKLTGWKEVPRLNPSLTPRHRAA